ncbi:MAG: hypothetical protein DHS20C18_07760 [Saprospiraceae bacterium]|nr:MAG: hypothetical protein DHS20C18_07760 [Saprospiraceae bacterium]
MKKVFILPFLVAISFLTKAQETAPDHYIFSIYFGGGSYYIDAEQEAEFYQWLESIPNFKQHQISVHSHTDDIGSQVYNEQLSQLRSEAARRRLLKKGVSSERISIEDFGELNPVYDNNTWEGKLKNRRVDIIIKPELL